MAKKSTDNPMFDMFLKFGESLQLPTPDVEAIVESNRKNIEAFQNMAETTAAGAQNVMAAQHKQLEQGLEEVSALVKNMVDAKSPGQAMSDQMAFAKKSFEATIKNATEVSEIARDTGTKSFQIMQERMKESVRELSESMKKKS
ncbi:MAG: TIGR01841 family phasin [Pseudomonadota bacterium]